MAQAKNADEKVIAKYGDGQVKKPCAVLLWSSLSSNAHQTAAQKKVGDRLDAFNIRVEQLDGAQEENKALRNKLFDVSNVRGKYPQLFIIGADDKPTYVGMDDEIDYLIDSDTFKDKMKSCIGN